MSVGREALPGYILDEKTGNKTPVLAMCLLPRRCFTLDQAFVLSPSADSYGPQCPFTPRARPRGICPRQKKTPSVYIFSVLGIPRGMANKGELSRGICNN